MLRLRSRTIGGLIVSESPAFDPEFEFHFRSTIARARYYLEFGSGASTLLAARSGTRTICIESDRRFARAVSKSVAFSDRVTVCHVDIGLTEEWGNPVFAKPTRKRLTRWSRYTGAAFDLIAADDGFPDMVLVDGRFRVACVLATAYHALQAGATTTVYLDDYSLRPHYKVVENYLGKPKMIGRAASFDIVPESLDPSALLRALSYAHADIR